MDKSTLLEIADRYGTPVYVFNTDVLVQRVQAVQTAFSNNVQLCYSMKANPFLSSIVPINKLEVCSPGELEICRALQLPPSHILYSGVNKTQKCIEDALDYDVTHLTAESPLQLTRIEQAAGVRGLLVEVLLRLTGDDQFGMDAKTVRRLIETRSEYPHTRLTGLHFFSGTQKRSAKVIQQELDMLIQFSDSLKQDFGFDTQKLEYGAGLFADYFGEDADAREMQLLYDIAPFVREGAKRFSLTVEMGRFFAASCGEYLTSVADIKTTDGKNIAIMDGGIHQVNYDGITLAPAPPPVTVLNNNAVPVVAWMIYGSLCSRGDVLARNIKLPQLTLSDILCFHQTGAYAATEGMAHFLSRDIPAIVLYNQKCGAILVRDHSSSHVLNTPMFTLPNKNT